MPERIPKSTAIKIPLQAYLASDHVSAATGKTIAITISKNGAAYGNPNAGATNATEIASGSYYVDLDTTDTGTEGPLFIKGSEGTIDTIIAIYNVVKATNGGLTALPDTACTTNASLLTSGTGTAQLSVSGGRANSDVLYWNAAAVSVPTNAGVPNVNAKTWNDLATVALPLVPTTAGRTLDVSAGGEAGIDWANVGSPTTVVGLSGTTVKTATDVEADTVDIQGRLPAALVSGRIDASVGAVAADAIDSTALAASAVTEIQSGLSTLTAAGVRTAVGLASANLDTQLDALPTAIENADALLNRDMSTGTDSGSATVRTVRQALRFLRNKWDLSGGTLTVKKEDDSTTSWTATVTTDASSEPVVGSDPASS